MSARRIGASWWVDIRHKSLPKGRARIKSPENTKAGAQSYEALLRQRLARGEPLEPEKPKQTMTFAEFVPEWFETYVRSNCKHSEIIGKESTLRYNLIPWFGKMRLQEIGLVNIEQYKAEKIKKGLKPKTINNHLAALSKCLSCAHEWGRMDSPPPKIKRLSAHSGRIDFLTPIESGQLLKDQKAPDWNLMVLLGLRTGMRFGELLGLDWTDIDWERKQLTVRQSLVRGVMGTPKSGKMRHIPMTKDLYEALSDRRKIRGLIFERPQGEKSTHRVATNALNQICKRTGVRKFGWHILRHTFASHLAMEGVALPYIQQLMGHASIIMTMRYAHLMPSKLNEAIEVLDTFEKRELAKYGQQVGNVAIKRCVSEIESTTVKNEVVAQP